jgi:hypothetical protein
MLRGLFEIVEPLDNIKNSLQPNLGRAFSILVGLLNDAIPKVQESYQEEHPYSIWRGELPSLKGLVVGASDALSTIHPNYLLVATTFVFVFFVLYIKMKYPFWNQIPALHVYDWHRRYLYSEKPYIVHPIPKKTKYYETAPLIQTKKFRDLEEERKQEICRLLQNHYLPSDRVFCSVQLPDVAAQCADALISTWNLVETVFGEDEPRQEIRQYEGFVTSRRIQTSLSFGESNDRYIVQEPANYIDYICFRRGGGGSVSSPNKIRRLFHTHEYNERILFPERQITLFKKEVELCEAIVPLVEYETLTFYLRYRIEAPPLPSNYQIVRIQREHLQYLHDWMERVGSLREIAPGFKVSVTTDIGDLIHLLQTNQMFAYVLRGPDPVVSTKQDAVYAIYFFRNAHMKYEDLEGGDTLYATNAFCNTNDLDLYFRGFVSAVREARKDLSGTLTKMLMVDDIGHLRGVAARWRLTHDVVLRTKCAYYFCNYIVPKSPYEAGSVNILI